MTQPAYDSSLSAPEGALADIWTCGVRVWSAYLADLLNARGLEDLALAQTRMLANGLDIFGLAAGEMLRRHGLSAPTLNDA